MAQILIDADGFQTLCDFETGEPMDEPSTQLMKDLMKITPNIPFPGDDKPEVLKWTVDAALELDKFMHPDLMFVSFATPMLIRSFYDMSEDESQAMYTRMFDEIKRFFAETDFEPMVIGGGSLSPVLGELDFSKISTKPVFSMFNHHYAGIYDASKEDGENLRKIEHLRKIITKEEYIKTNPGLSQEYLDMMPDYIVMRDTGYAYNLVAKRGYTVKMLADVCEELPVYTTLEQPKHIRDVYSIVNKELTNGKRVAVMLLEGTGEKEFQLPYTMVDNCDDLYCYEQGVSLYRVINSGKKYSEEKDPPVVQHHSAKGLHQYPFSMLMSGVPTGNLGQRADKVTASVGTRSGFTHSYCMADVNIECHARNLASSGVLAVVTDKE